MAHRDPFKGHLFPKDVILLAVRWQCRFPLSYRVVRDFLAERGIVVDAATVYRWVQKLGPEIRKRAYGRQRNWPGLQWHVDETYLRVNDRWCYLWRAIDQSGQLIDFRLTAKRPEPPPMKWSAPMIIKAEDLRWPLRDLSLKRLS